MIKNVKSLIVAGLLVVGMSGNVFADKVPAECFVNVGSHDAAKHEHVITEADLVKAEDFEAFLAKLSAESDKHGYILKKETLKDGRIKVEVFIDWNLDGKIENYTQVGSGKLIEEEKVLETIYFKAGDEKINNKGLLPEIPDIVPGTGDGLMLGGLAIALVAGAIVVFVNKKDKKDE